MDKIKYTGMLAFKLVRKVLGLVLFWPAVPFRKYARSVVQNYWLQNDILVKRLRERHPRPVTGGWALEDVHGVGYPGFVRSRPPVAAWHYWLVVWCIWGWLDDDSNHDTFDAGHIQKRHLDEESWQSKILGGCFRKALAKNPAYGNTFDLGDLRASRPAFSWCCSWIWSWRNSAYNFSYLFEQTAKPQGYGWEPDGEVDGIPYWQMK